MIEEESDDPSADNYPGMAAIDYIQQFALLNKITMTGIGGYGSPLYPVSSRVEPETPRYNQLHDLR